MSTITAAGKEQKTVGRMVIFEILLTLALSVGCFFTLFSMIELPVGLVATLPPVIIFSVGMYLLARHEFLGKYLLFYVPIGIALYCVIFYTRVWKGVLIWLNGFIFRINETNGGGMIPFRVSGGEGTMESNAVMFILPLIILVCAAIGYSVYRKDPLISFFVTAAPVILALAFGGNPSMWALILFFVGLIGLFLISPLAKPRGVKDKKPIYLEPKNPSTLPFIFLSVILVLLLSYSILFTGENYRAPQSLAEAKTALISMEEHLRYGGKKIEGLSSGDLSKTHSLEYEEAPALTITMEKPAVMHLRGFIGSVYEEGKWKELEKEAYGGEYVGLMKWLEDKNFWPQAQMNNLYRMNEASEFATIKIKNNNASRKYFYAPYEISLSDDAAPKKVNYQQDNLSRTKGIGGDKNYEYKVFYPSLGEYSSATAEAWLAQLRQSPDYPAYEEAEKVYRKFVYDTYLRVPEEEKENLAVLGVEACRDKTIDYILYYLRNQFTQNYRYDIEYAGAPEGKDELSYFVNQSRIGNDMHFNTAATLLLREAGIPARYVEGYYLSEAFMFYYEDMVNFEFEIPDSLSHGWVEIYVDELGWQPVEMTPGFYNVDKEQIEQEQDTDQIKEFDQATYPDEVEFNLPGEVDKAAAVKKLIIKKILPILAILLVILAVELCGRLWLKRRKAGFAQEGRKSVMQMYRYICTLMKFDKLDIKKDPRGKVGLAEEAYDGFTRNSFEEILSLIYDVRFGNRSLEEEEHKKIARYTEELGNGIYKKQRRIKRLIMRFVRFIY